MAGDGSAWDATIAHYIVCTQDFIAFLHGMISIPVLFDNICITILSNCLLLGRNDTQKSLQQPEMKYVLVA